MQETAISKHVTYNSWRVG